MAAPETESKELDQDEIIEEEVESSEEQDETLEDESLEEDLGDETEEEEAQPSFDRAFTQFQGETVEEYAKNLEEGYRNTSKEGLRLSATNKELEVRVNQLMAAVAKNPELAATLNATQDNKPAAPSAAAGAPPCRRSPAARPAAAPPCPGSATARRRRSRWRTRRPAPPASGWRTGPGPPAPTAPGRAGGPGRRAPRTAWR